MGVWKVWIFSDHPSHNASAIQQSFLGSHKSDCYIEVSVVDSIYNETALLGNWHNIVHGVVVWGWPWVKIHGMETYCICPKYWDTLTHCHICPKIWTRLFYFLLICLKWCLISGKQCRSRSDATFCGIWAGSLHCLLRPVCPNV